MQATNTPQMYGGAVLVDRGGIFLYFCSMKIKKLHIGHFKRFPELTLDFCDPESGEPLDMVLLVGENGSGKSSILQAIALAIGTAAKHKFDASSLSWPGFSHKQISPKCEIRATVNFSNAENQSTAAYVKRLNQESNLNLRPPAQENEIEITLSDAILTAKVAGHKWVDTATSDALLCQFKGQQYALQLIRYTPNYYALFNDVGTVIWFDEHRNQDSFFKFSLEGDTDQLTAIRSLLSKWSNFHFNRKANPNFVLLEGQVDFFERLRTLYERVFQGRTLLGSEPKMDPESFFDDESYFFLQDGDKRYELSEMSGGERAIFPLLITFARWNINHSIVLIDELELHLHPPLQQALVRALPLLGQGNQFIITSHSDDVAALFSGASIKRAPLWR